MSWWLKNNIRMVQNNLRAVDAGIDSAKHVEMLKELGANVAMVGCGGITSLYPTDLDTQIRSPFLKDDFIGNMVRECHKNDIKVIVRFDFTKTDVSLYEKYPEWYTINSDGKPLLYNGTAAACVNGEYQQKHMLEVIREVLERYPVDGIFFNAFMYNVWDYDGNFYGICQCENCKKRFKEMYGEMLPTEENPTDPVYRKYAEFQSYTLKDLLDKVKDVVKSINPDIAISTYNDTIDIIRNESNNAVDRPLPFWTYTSADNTGSIVDTYNDRISSNVAINFVDFFARFMGVSKHLIRINLLENMASGSGLDWCIVGSFEDHPDRKSFDVVKEVFQFHKNNEQYYGKFISQARILLVKDKNNHFNKFNAEYRGIFKILKESHRLFNIAKLEQLDKFVNKLNEFDVIILPGIESTGSTVFDEALKKTTACVIATGLSMEEQSENLQDLFGVSLGDKLEKVRGSYIKTEPKTIFKDFKKTDWVYLDKDYRYMKLDKDNEGFLQLISSASFGPPERCFGHEVTDQVSVSIKDKQYVYFPWMVGSLYYRHGYEEFKNLFLNLLDYVSPKHNAFSTNAPSCVEMFFNKIGDNQYLLQLINLSGCNGTTVNEALPIYDIEVTLSDIIPKQIYELTHGEKCMLKATGNTVKIDRIFDYNAYVIEV